MIDMRRVVALPLLMLTPLATSAPESGHPPATKTVPVTDKLHGVEIQDPYRWLEDEHASDVQAWISAQDRYARAQLATLAGRAELTARMKELLYYEALGAPMHRGKRYFYTRKRADQEKTAVYWKQDLAGEEHVLFDPNTWSQDGSKGMKGWYPSLDGNHVAYNVSEHNSDEAEMHVHDVAAGKDLPDVIPGTKYSALAWAPDGSGFYYTWLPPVDGKRVTVADRSGLSEVRFHRLGNDPAKDQIIREATHDPTTNTRCFSSRDGHWLFAMTYHGWRSTDVYFKDARVHGAPWTTLVAGAPAQFNVEVWHDRFYVHTNDGAPRYRVFAVDPAHPARAAWKELVAQSDATLDSIAILGEHLVLSYVRAAATQLEIADLDGRHVHDVALPPLGTATALVGNPDEDTAYVSYTSFTEPQVIYKVSIQTGKVDEYARVKLPIDTSRFVTEQVFFPSKDGTRVSMFVIHRKDVTPTGANPTILYGYGGFNTSMTPSFSGERVVWLERGGVYAIPNLRGGGEYGEDWHHAGMLLQKQNVFDDIIAAAEYLIAHKWTSRDHLAVSGRSNGGLTVGAAVTQRPELFRAAICTVPLLDMLRYHLFGAGTTWVSEYGSADDAEQFKALYAYSPYRRAIDAGRRAYPAVLFESTDHDDRVDPMHARKLAAVLQANQTASAPILLRIERNAGHQGADMVRQQVDATVDELVFLLHWLK